ncbi:MAG: response regulator [Ferruginibacter sp.]
MKPIIVKTPIVLVVDDEEDLLFLIKRKLEKEGYEVVISPNGEHLKESIDSSHPDIILLDITMRDKSGADICKDLKTDEHTSNIPVILFSGNDNIVETASTCGADGYISKPFDVSSVKKVFEDALKKHAA